MYLGYQDNKIKFYTENELPLEFYNLDSSVYTTDEYVLNGEEYVLNDEAYQEELAEIEKERISNLTLTHGQMEKGIFKATNKNFSNILTEMEIACWDTEVLKQLAVELNAECFVRSNPYVSLIGSYLGITEEKLDLFFEDGDFTTLL